MLRAWFVIKL